MKRSRIVASALVLAMICSLAACGPKEADTTPTPEVPSTPEAGMTAGEYKTTCKGYYGDFELTVTVSDTAITGITYGEHSETVGVGALAVDMMIERMIEANTSGVDSVTGATMTSIAVRNAVTDCLKQAGAPKALTASAPAPQKSEHTLKADVVVVGGGGSGMAAAIAAKEAGANVILLEKQDILGGTTLVSAGIVYGALSDEDVPGMVDYYMQRAEGNADREMLTYYAQHSRETLNWLQSLGTMIMFEAPAGTAPEPRARFTMLADGTNFIGYTLTHPMEEKCKELGVDIHTGVKATELIQNADGAIVGVKGEGKDGAYTVNAKAVILCAGGYDASTAMKDQYSPDYTNDFPLSNKGNVGEGIQMGIAVGADTVFKGGIIGFTCLNAALPQSGYSSLAMAGAAWAAADGTYLAPNVDYPITHALIKEQPSGYVFGLLDNTGAENGEAALALGYGFKGDTISNLAVSIGADEAKLADAFDQAGLAEAPFYVIKVSPTSIGSMGGLKVNTNSEVLKNGQPIPGLYAAGETANGDFYYREYPASGSSNCISITFGLQAGRQAAKLATGAAEPAVEATATPEP
ncbi:MAG: FAD-dependent oxidoreductase, partial [Oscillospiraceae bacterium]|nr:FAD-dependent oxidoreductase [Oscillospiraceae bacterium]